MGKPTGATADFGRLRQYANHLMDCSDLIGHVVKTLEVGPVPNHVWGVPGPPMAAQLNGYLGNPDGWDRRISTIEDRAPELEKFKATYELAHAVTVERIQTLSRAYARAGELLRETARQYEELEGVEPATAPPTPKQHTLPEKSDSVPNGGFQAAEGDRRSVWEMTGGEGVREALIKTGFGETIPAFDAYIGVNTEQMKRIAQVLYGTTGSYNSDWVLSDCHIGPSNTFAPFVLDEIKEISRVYVVESVGNNWEGDGFDKFKTYHDKLVEVTSDEASRLRRIGDILYGAAETIEGGKNEIENSIAGATGKLLEGVDAINTLRKKIDPFDIAIKVAQKALKAYQDAEEENAKKSAEADKYTESGGKLEDLVIAAPSTSQALPELPEVDLGKWDPQD